MVKKSILFLSLCVLVFVSIMAILESNDRICLGNEYGVNSLNNEFQTIFHEVIIDHRELKNRVLRGKVVSYLYIESAGVLAGELDISALENKYLSDLIEDEDKSGFFIINTRTGLVISGLEENEYAYRIKELIGYVRSPKHIGYFDRFYWSCLGK